MSNDFFTIDKKTEDRIEEFLDYYKIEKKFKGRQFLKDIIIYCINYNISYYDLNRFNDVYKIVAKYEGETWYNIRRLSTYAANLYFIKNGNPTMAHTPSELVIMALNEIHFNEKRKD